MSDHVQFVVAGEDMVTLELVAEDVVAPTARAGRRQARRQGGGQAGVVVGGRRREVKGEGDGGRARGDRDDGLADELAAGRRAEAGGGRRGRGRAVEREVETA